MKVIANQGHRYNRFDCTLRLKKAPFFELCCYYGVPVYISVAARYCRAGV